MYVRCAVCNEWLDTKPGALNAISHSVCSDCFDREWERFQASRAARTPASGGEERE